MYRLKKSNYTHIFMFQLYLVLIILFLVPLCYLATNSILKISTQVLTLSKIKNWQDLKRLEKNDFFYIKNMYIDRRKWLHCILMLEFQAENGENDSEESNYPNCIRGCIELMKLKK